jgi:GNAT superfamily N-acetyltransferase
MLMDDFKEINFDVIEAVWRNNLWPGRKSKIEPISIIDHQGKFDKKILEYKPYFWGMYHDKELIGVISGMQTSEQHFRSRGIWVNENFRKLHVGSKLMNAVIEKSKELNCFILWSMPRCESWEFYEKNGFHIEKKLENFEFGPHYIAVKLLTR